MREIVLDTETTGLNPLDGDRIVEIGCVELINHIPSGVEWHSYLNPQRSMPDSAFAIHGLSEDFLSDKALFSDISQEFLDFIGDDNLVIHNASFDVGFLDAELDRLFLDSLKADRIIDALQLARGKHPNTPVSLNALCRHYKIDNSSRSRHGALLDAKLLAEVYLELIGGSQKTINFTQSGQDAHPQHTIPSLVSPRPIPYTRQSPDWELAAHRSSIHLLGSKALWLKYIED